MKKQPKPAAHAVSIERLSHFRCASCKKWWSVGDAPAAKKVWYCPWCGTKGEAKK